MKLVQKLLFGSAENLNLSDRIYIVINFIIATTFFIAAILISFLTDIKDNLSFVIGQLILFIVYGTFYYLARFRKKNSHIYFIWLHYYFVPSLF